MKLFRMNIKHLNDWKLFTPSTAKTNFLPFQCSEIATAMKANKKNWKIIIFKQIECKIITFDNNVQHWNRIDYEKEMKVSNMKNNDRKKRIKIKNWKQAVFKMNVKHEMIPDVDRY